MASISSLREGAIPVVSPQQARDEERANRWFGPVYHGTRADIDEILRTGFEIDRSMPTGTDVWGRPVGTSNGYVLQPYGNTGIAAPVHHLGFGVYFTTVKSIAKQYAGGSARGLREFFIDAPKGVEEINFGAAGTMMRWWLANGYDMTAEETAKRDLRAWIRATKRLTQTLAQKHDAVWFKGKGMFKLLDGDQVCVYDPARIVVVNPKLATGLEIGARVVHTQVIQPRYRRSNEVYVDDLRPTDFRSWGKLGTYGGWRGVFRSVDWQGNDLPRGKAAPTHIIPPPGTVGVITDKREVPDHLKAEYGAFYYDVKWSKGGLQHNYIEGELAPA